MIDSAGNHISIAHLFKKKPACQICLCFQILEDDGINGMVPDEGDNLRKQVHACQSGLLHVHLLERLGDHIQTVGKIVDSVRPPGTENVGQSFPDPGTGGSVAWKNRL